MRKCKIWIENIPGSPYSQSRKHDVPKKDREDADDYDCRTWREHCTVTAQNQVSIPAMAIKQSIDTAAQKLGLKVAGRKGATYKGFFASGFFCEEDVPLSNGKPILKDKVEMIAISANSNGKRGAGSRVTRRFPIIPEWNGTVSITVTDNILTPEIFETHVRAAGIVVGIGRFRPELGGVNGRFRATKFQWENFEL
jgi:hypothetical protein